MRHCLSLQTQVLKSNWSTTCIHLLHNLNICFGLNAEPAWIKNAGTHERQNGQCAEFLTIQAKKEEKKKCCNTTHTNMIK